MFRKFDWLKDCSGYCRPTLLLKSELNPPALDETRIELVIFGTSL
jgi:hypothetical protein